MIAFEMREIRAADLCARNAGATRQRSLLLCGAAGLAVALFAAPAEAACSPDPTVANSTTTCTGVDSDGVSVPTASTTVRVSAGATVGGAAARPISSTGADTRLLIEGTVDGRSMSPAGGAVQFSGARPRVDVVAGGAVLGGEAALRYIPASNGTIAVDNAGRIEAAGTAILLQSSPGARLSLVNRTGGIVRGGVAVGAIAPGAFAFDTAAIDLLDNSGTLAGTSGLAIDLTGATNQFRGSIQSLVNRAGGTIGGEIIVNGINQLSNAGLIDGGARSAITQNQTFGNWRNLGTITSAAASPTIAAVGVTITNSGTLSNTGGGAVLATTQPANLTNLAGGLISSSGPIALSLGGGGTVDNGGRIVGDVNLPTVAFVNGRIVQRGAIQGSVRMGSGDDLFLVDAGAISSGTGVTGTIDAGSGSDGFGYTTSAVAAATLNGLPATFERIVMEASGTDAVLTVGGTAAGAPVSTQGSGTVISTLNITTSGDRALQAGAAKTINRGTIDFTGQAAIANQRRAAFDFGGLVINEGTVIARGAQSLVTTNAGSFENQATVRLLDGAALAANGSVINSGLIDIASSSSRLFGADVTTPGNLDNRGIITAVGPLYVATANSSGSITNSGLLRSGSRAIDLSAITAPSRTSLIENSLSGTIEGNGGAILGGAGREQVTNAGRIVGSVNLGAGEDLFFSTGRLEGDLLLGEGNDIFQIDVAKPGVVTGAIDPGAGIDIRRLVARSDAIVDVVADSRFEVTDLVVTGPTTTTLPRPTVTNRTVLAADVGASAVLVSGNALFTNSAALSAGGNNAAGIRTPTSFIANPTILNDGAITVTGGASGIDAGAGIAVNRAAITGSGTGVLLANARLENSGRIVTTNPAVRANGGTSRLVNNGLLESSTGPAVVAAAGATTVQNRAGGNIRGGGGVAIQGGPSGTTVVNAGHITGDVSLGAGADTYQYDGGTIDGRLILGAGNDRVYVGTYGPGVVLATGGVDAGDGEDIFAFAVDSTRAIDLAPVVGFEALGVTALGNDTTLTLSKGASPLDARLELGGEGLIVNERAMARTGGIAIELTPGARFINRATIDVTGGGNNTVAAVLASVGFAPTVTENAGTLRATGAAATGFTFLGGSFGNEARVIELRNSGTIAANDGATAILAFGPATVRNTGSIVVGSPSTAIQGGGDLRVVNAGSITGAGNGIALSNGVTSEGGFTNTGLVEVGGAAITGANSGVVVNSGRLASTTGAALQLVSSFAGSTYVTNEVGGVIAGVGEAISAGPLTTLRVANRGTINGSVNFAAGNGTGSGSDLFFADGGRVIGDVRFGATDDLFIVPLSQADNPSASISGTLDMGAGTDTLLLRATSSATATVRTTAAGFERVAYEAAGRSTNLTLTSATPLAQLSLIGDGAFDLTADFAADGTALGAGSTTTAGLFSTIGTSAPSGGRVISRGIITSTSNSSAAGVTVSNIERFENAGTIRMVQPSGSSVTRVAISGNGTVVNSGHIEISEMNVGVGGATLFVNSGVVEQTSGLSAMGASNVRAVENNGTIRTGDLGVFALQTRIVNRGTIESINNSAIGGGSALVVNSATGRLIGRPGLDAIANFSGSNTLINAGAIAGDVTFGSGDDLFIAAGGQIEGTVSLGAGNDTYLVRGTSSGASRGVTNGGGRDAYGRSFDSTATYALEKPADYDMYAVQATGLSTLVTVTSALTAEGGIRVYGDGAVENRADINLSGTFGLSSAAPAAVELRRIGDSLDESTMRFTNRANVASTAIGIRSLGDGFVAAGLAQFDNAGAVDARYQAAALAVETRANGVNIVNSGMLTSKEGPAALQVDVIPRPTDQKAAALPTIDVTNSGTISNVATGAFAVGAQISAGATALRAVNSGTIEGAGEKGGGLEIAASQLTLNNSGRLIATGSGGDALHIELSRFDSLGNSVPAASSQVTNEGLIQATGKAAHAGVSTASGEFVVPSSAASVESSGAFELRNGATGTIESTGDRSVGLRLRSVDNSTTAVFTISNAGLIRGTGTTFASYETLEAGSNDRILAGGIHSVGAIDAITNAATGRILGGINLGAGDDSLENYGRIEGSILLGSGNDRFVQALAGAFVGTADGGDGVDTLVFDITGGGTIDFRQYKGFENISQRGRGAVTFAGLEAGAPLPIETFTLADTGFTLAAGQTFATRGATALTGSTASESVVNAGTIGGSVDLGAGNDTLVNSGTINGNILMGDGDDVVTNNGRVSGSVLLGNGVDRYVTNGLASVGGTVDGGDGNDTLEFAVAGTATAPTVWNGTGTAGFETLLLSQGTLSLTGTTPSLGATNVAGGYLVGQVGSILNAGTVNVAAGAIFGSAGRVVGNVNVAGTLSPGASPGTMTVIGNVALAPGSTTFFELTPTVSDQLLVSGTTSIGTNATLRLTGTRGVTSAPLDLVVSDGGISGSFATVNKDPGIVGFVAQRGNRLQLFSQFASSPGFGAPANAAIAYVNTAIAAGQLSPALAAALPALLDAQGGSASTAFGELTPEVYATASNYGAARALLLADSVRTAARGLRDDQGSFVFAQGVGEWTDADGGPASSAEFETRGVFGGLGYQFETGSSVSAFVGALDGEARTDALRARTDVDGISFGISGRLLAGSFAIDTTFAYDAGKGKLSRTLSAGGSALNTRFDLHTLVADLSVSRPVSLSENWTLVPRIGVTHVGTDRDGVAETGSAFALTTDDSHNNRLFGTLGASVEGRFASIAPFAHVGIRHLIDGREPMAAGQFAGVSGTPLRATGAYLGDDVVSIGGGATVDLSARLRLTGGYEAKVGDRDSHAVTVGLSAAF